MNSKKFIYNYSKLIKEANLSVSDRNYLLKMINGDLEHTLTKQKMDTIIEAANQGHNSFLKTLIALRDKCK
jgi:rRNA pseudouridine-1189 N-methylase Emg1 (Nep1/Mra1 family)